MRGRNLGKELVIEQLSELIELLIDSVFNYEFYISSQKFPKAQESGLC